MRTCAVVIFPTPTWTKRFWRPPERDRPLGADLKGARLSVTELDGSDLSSAKLAKADLSEANLTNADLSRANLAGPC